MVSLWAMMQATGGFGKVEPWAERAREMAARIILVSSMCCSCGDILEVMGGV